MQETAAMTLKYGCSNSNKIIIIVMFCLIPDNILKMYIFKFKSSFPDAFRVYILEHDTCKNKKNMFESFASETNCLTRITNIFIL